MESKEFHLNEAKKCFNDTWNYIDKEKRSTIDVLEMIRLAQASRYHWSIVGTALEFERGEWLISKVYALAGYGDLALLHANECLRICLEHKIEDFDICFAYEAIANAYKALGDEKKKEEYKALANSSVEAIKDDGDKAYTKSEIDKI
jgi:hypothetical protein